MHEFEQHLALSPRIATETFIAPSADIVGDVTIGRKSSVWFQCVLRGDINSICVGEETNVQDGTIIHVSSSIPAVVGDRVTCGHRAIIHACTIHDEVLVGMGATVMDRAKIGSGTIVAAGALVTKGTEIPQGVLVMGSPARIIRELTKDERDSIPALAEKYCCVAAAHAPPRLPPNKLIFIPGSRTI